MGAQNTAAPVIIKRKKVVAGDGHHGGAWKVAYADFVTAMMAFFLLMWLLNATTEKQRKGIAEYFSPTVPLARISGGGDGVMGGDSLFSEMTMARTGTGGSIIHSAGLDQPRVHSETSDTVAGGDAVLRSVENALIGLGGESMTQSNLLRHIVTRVTDEGLVIELFDIDDATLFKGQTDQPTDLLTALSAMLSRALVIVRNPVAIGGHVAAQPVVRLDNTVWSLSADRADAMRRLLENHGMPAIRVARVTGHADRELSTSDPMSPQNNRLEVVLLRTEG